MKFYNIFYLLLVLQFACGRSTDADTPPTTQGDVAADALETDSVAIHPIYHGSIVLEHAGRTIFVDPHGGADRYTSYGAPDLVLITHTHGDHLDPETLSGIDLTSATLVAPQAVMEALEDTSFTAMHTIGNGESHTWEDIRIEAIPAYNFPPKEFHPEGEFNGYVLNVADQRLYISGDTEGVPAMRELDDIDVAFVCMNLPYTMDIDQAASAVIEFAPEVVYPYHYRNQDGSKSDVEAFQRMVTEENDDIEVRLATWYE